MNTIIRSFFIICLISITSLTQAISVLVKDINLGEDPATKKILMVKAYAFVEGRAETANTRWLGIIAYEKELFMYSIHNNKTRVTPISQVVTTQPSFDILLDPVTGKEWSDEQHKEHSHFPITLHVTLAPEIQIFKELIILMAQNNTKALTSLVDKHSFAKINEIIDSAIESQAAFLPKCDDNKTLASILQKKQALVKPVTLTGQVTFFTVDEFSKEIIEGLDEEAEQAAE